jgi:hypothetical protein
VTRAALDVHLDEVHPLDGEPREDRVEGMSIVDAISRIGGFLPPPSGRCETLR